MKKTVLVLGLLGLVVSAHAQNPGEQLLSYQPTAAVKAVEKTVRQKVAEGTSKQEIGQASENATKLLEKLSARYPQNKQLQEVVVCHRRLVMKGLREGKEEAVAQHMYLAQEELLEAVKSLSAEDAQLGEIVELIINHDYWVKQQRQGYTLAELRSWAHRLFPNLPAEK